MNESDVMEDTELEKVLQNMSVDDFVLLMLALGQEQDQEEDGYQCSDEMHEAYIQHEMEFA